MAKARAIVKRLKAIKNIHKITRTMELIATARFKRAMDRASEAAAYTRKISELVADLSQVQLQFTHPLLESRETQKNAVVLIMTSNRGLCGGYNGSVLRMAQQRIAALEADSNVILEVSGKRGLNLFRFLKRPVDAPYTHFEDKPSFDEVNVLANKYIEAYIRKDIDRLDVIYTKFQTVSRQSPIVETLLPIQKLADDTTAKETAPESRHEIQYEFLPSAQEILEEIVPAAFKARLFKCFLDAAVSEQISRMVAMKRATENGTDMIRDIRMQYNRARQTQITSELSEIIGGAAALE